MKKNNFIAFLTIFLGFATLENLEANCAKCSKIEAEREEEQARNPKDAGYYDDYLKSEASSKKSKEEVKPAALPNSI